MHLHRYLFNFFVIGSIVQANILWRSQSEKSDPLKTDFDEYNCRCQPNQVWNDIIYIFSTSSSMSRIGLEAAQANMKSMIEQLNIQKKGYIDSKYFASVGIISYDTTANVVYQLGSVNSTDLMSMNIPYTGNDNSATNLESAIGLAINQFAINGRPTSKPVIQIYAASYDPSGVHSPLTVVNQFKEFGIVIVFDYVESAGAPDAMMSRIATPGYFIDSRYAAIDASINMMCSANCLCGPNDMMMGINAQGGCFVQLSGAPSTYPLNICSSVSSDNTGVVAMDSSANISVFINGVSTNVQQWNGIKWMNGHYQWADGTALTSSSYAPWGSTPTLPPPIGSECVMMARATGSSMKWYQANCNSVYNYMCQSAPCDSTRWCNRLNSK